MAVNFNKQVSVIKKSEREGRPLYTNGARVRGIGFPTDKAGRIILGAGTVSFEASIDGSHWFTMNDFSGAPVRLVVKAAQNVIPPAGSLATSPAFLPIRDPQLFEGMVMIRPILDRDAVEDVQLEIYQELSNL